MNTEIIQKPKKKFSIGGVLAIITALAVAGGSLISALWNFAAAAEMAYYFFVNREMMGGDSVVSYVYLSHFISSFGSATVSLCALVTALALAVLGALLLFKVSSKALGFVCVAPAAVSVTAIAIPAIGLFVRIGIMLLYDVSWAIGNLVTQTVTGVIGAIPNIAVALCWVAMAVAIFVLGGSEKYSKSRATAGTIAAAVVAVLFAVAHLAAFLAVALINGGSLLIDGMNIVFLGGIYGGSLSRLGEMLVMIVVGAIRNGILGTLLAVTSFFAVRWIVSPYKKVK